MGLERLLEALERDAEAQVERTLAEARAEAARITEESTAAIAKRRQETTAEHERARAHEVEHAVTLARREARRSILDARERLLERVLDAARAELPAAAAGASYQATLPAALERALAAVGATQAVVRCPPFLARCLEHARPPASAGVSVLADPAAGSGFRVASADGAVEVDGTLESRLDRLRPVLARAVLARLELGP